MKELLCLEPVKELLFLEPVEELLFLEPVEERPFRAAKRALRTRALARV
jgi:hypothetical protein